MNISIGAEQLFSLFGLPVTNSMLVAWVVSGILVMSALVLTRKLSDIPRGFQNIVESVIEGIIKLVDSVTGNRAQSQRFFPLVATIFIFVLLVNWVGLFPGMGGAAGVLHREGEHTVIVPFIRATSADLNFTLALALVSVATVQITGIAAIGFWKYIGKFFNLSNPLHFFVGILELVSEVAKLISFSFRLFGNIFAGEVLLTVMYFLVPYIIPLPFLALEVFVGLIQAIVFAMLTLVFLKMATEEAHH